MIAEDVGANDYIHQNRRTKAVPALAASGR